MSDPRLPEDVDPAAKEYKVVELATVTDEEVERVLNDLTRSGWAFEGMQFAMREASRRPSMAFLFFSRRRKDDGVADA